MKRLFLILALFSIGPNTVYAETNTKLENLVIDYQQAIASIETGMSLNTYSTVLLKLQEKSDTILSDKSIQDSEDYQSLKRHIDKINYHMNNLAQLWKSQERDGYKFIDFYLVQDEYRLMCHQVQIRGQTSCTIPSIKDSMVLETKKEIEIVQNGIKDRF